MKLVSHALRILPAGLALLRACLIGESEKDLPAISA